MRDRTNEKWTERQKEWLGYRRKIANFKKSSVSLSKPPWEKKIDKKEIDKEKN
tara:strand:- start:275 stop:433 length:159 start_codon:yes stop_codon:yes gene_type:complete